MRALLVALALSALALPAAADPALDAARQAETGRLQLERWRARADAQAAYADRAQLEAELRLRALAQQPRAAVAPEVPGYERDLRLRADATAETAALRARLYDRRLQQMDDWLARAR